MQTLNSAKAIINYLNCSTDRTLILTKSDIRTATLMLKLKRTRISSKRYKVEPITSFAFRYVKSFYCGNDLLLRADKNYWEIIVEKARELIKIKHISDVIKNSYGLLLVDEFDDYTISQKSLITDLTINSILPTIIFTE
jgi:hypothetical protein